MRIFVLYKTICGFIEHFEIANPPPLALRSGVAAGVILEEKLLRMVCQNRFQTAGAQEIAAQRLKEGMRPLGETELT